MRVQSQFIEMFGNPLSSKQKNELKKLGECCSINPRRPNITLHETDKVSFVPMSSVSEDGYLVDLIDKKYGNVKKALHILRIMMSCLPRLHLVWRMVKGLLHKALQME